MKAVPRGVPGPVIAEGLAVVAGGVAGIEP